MSPGYPVGGKMISNILYATKENECFHRDWFLMK
jgi:hypothetical protein